MYNIDITINLMSFISRELFSLCRTENVLGRAKVEEFFSLSAHKADCHTLKTDIPKDKMQQIAILIVDGQYMKFGNKTVSSLYKEVLAS